MLNVMADGMMLAAVEHEAAGGVIVLFFGLLYCCFVGGIGLLVLANFAFWIWSIIEVATKEPSEEPNKMVWLILVILVNPIGGIVYFFARRPERIKKYGR